MIARRYRGSLAVWALLLGYASLYPFFPLRVPSAETVGLFFNGPRYFIRSDIAFNVVAYLPLGMFACLYFRSVDSRNAIWKAVALGAAFSLTMEILQLFVPNRHASPIDLASNAAGAMVGALAFYGPVHRVVTKPLGELRESMVIQGAWGDAGLVLVMLWLLAQLNPALPFFGAGDVGAAGTEAVLVQASAVAMAIAGFGLFVSSVLQRERGALTITLVLLSVALWLKFAAAPLLLQPHCHAEWMSEGRIAGLAVGVGVLLPLRKLSRPARVYAGLLLILAGALFSKIFGAYSPVEELVRLFRWPHGQIGSFATLTRFLHELWPFGAVAFLASLFLRERYLAAAQAASEA